MPSSGLRGDGETSWLGSRDPMDDGISCSLHGARRARRCCVHGELVQRVSLIGAYWLAIKPKVSAYVVAKLKNEARSSRLSKSRK
jgi:hypothetical protein